MCASPPHPGVSHGLVHHGLLVAGLVIGHENRVVGVQLQQRLSDTGDVPVAEDAEGARDRAFADAPVDRPLIREEGHQGLRHRHPARG